MLEVAGKVLYVVFLYLVQNNVLFEGVLLKLSLVTQMLNTKQKASLDD